MESPSAVAAVLLMIAVMIIPTIAYVAVRIYGAHEAAPDHPVVHFHR